MDAEEHLARVGGRDGCHNEHHQSRDSDEASKEYGEWVREIEWHEAPVWVWCVVAKLCTVDKKAEGYEGSQCGEDEGSHQKACGCHLSPGNSKAARGNEEGRNRGQENLFGHLILPKKKQTLHEYHCKEPHSNHNLGDAKSCSASWRRTVAHNINCFGKLAAECDFSVSWQSMNYYRTYRNSAPIYNLIFNIPEF